MTTLLGSRWGGDVLGNVTLYWLTNTAISSARFYRGNAHDATGGFFDADPPAQDPAQRLS
jgi:hypothetical protein